MSNPKKGKPKTRRSTQVPGQFYGYSLQITRAVAHLLRAHPGQSISVEHLDDVASSGGSGLTVEQDKSGLAHNPVANRAIELWKTLHNWVLAIRDGALKQDTQFIVFVAQNHHGDVIDRIHAVRSHAEASLLVSALRDEYWGPPPQRALRATLPDLLAVHVNGVLSASDDVIAGLFVNMSLENGSGSPNDDVLTALRLKALSENALEPILTHLLGWAKRSIDKHIEKGTPAILAWEDFNKQLVAAAKKFDRSDNLLQSTATVVTPAEIQAELRSRTYVHQLEIVKCLEADLVRAVNEFLRAAIDRTTWSERGDVIEDSFREFEEGLQRGWRNHSTRLEIEQKAATEEDRGRLLHVSCVGLQIRLQGMEVPGYFVPGSFHTLADSLQIGWHPRYQELIGAGTSRATDATAAPGNGGGAQEGGTP